MAKKQPTPVARIGRIVGEPYYTEDGRKFARVVFDPLSDEPEPAPKKFTQKQRMILAIVQRDYRRRTLPTIAAIHNHVVAMWSAECVGRKPPVKLAPPHRDTVARTLRAASLIK